MRCEYELLGERCSKKAVYVVDDDFIDSIKWNYCSKHAEIEHPFTKLKRIDNKNGL